MWPLVHTCVNILIHSCQSLNSIWFFKKMQQNTEQDSRDAVECLLCRLGGGLSSDLSTHLPAGLSPSRCLQHPGKQTQEDDWSLLAASLTQTDERRELRVQGEPCHPPLASTYKPQCAYITLTCIRLQHTYSGLRNYVRNKTLKQLTDSF